MGYYSPIQMGSTSFIKIKGRSYHPNWRIKMKKSILLIGCIFLSLSIAGCDNMTKQDMGVLTGGAIGGLVGSQFGSGSGQAAAMVGGTVLGAFLGSQIGKSMDQTDRNKVQIALENSRTNHSTSWKNPDTGVRYRVKPVKTYKSKRGNYCREYITQATVAGKKQQVYGTACRQPDGTWKIVK